MVAFGMDRRALAAVARRRRGAPPWVRLHGRRRAGCGGVEGDAMERGVVVGGGTPRARLRRACARRRAGGAARSAG
eukprot:CAMPEP_0184270590 /NCGR_PEP_ID=MMETSP0977-20130417/37463_1 /TAXON_ID=483370 /ORGANISM="non described non described, Strain CCMP2097" /LENGTH=75 /DNA_ID=CAMNT_0026576429 /DNA_START=25 /DNA_END=248 /DNA_ORIENTATION=-